MNLPERVREGRVRIFVLLDEHILRTLAFELTLDLVIANSCIQQPLWNLSPMHHTDWQWSFFLPAQTWRIPTPTILDLLSHWYYLLFTVPHPVSPPFPVLLHVKPFKHSLHCIYIAALFSFGKHHILIKSNFLPTSGLTREPNKAGVKMHGHTLTASRQHHTSLIQVFSMFWNSYYTTFLLHSTHTVSFISLLLCNDLI